MEGLAILLNIEDAHKDYIIRKNNGIIELKAIYKEESFFNNGLKTSRFIKSFYVLTLKDRVGKIIYNGVFCGNRSRNAKAWKVELYSKNSTIDYKLKEYICREVLKVMYKQGYKTIDNIAKMDKFFSYDNIYKGDF